MTKKDEIIEEIRKIYDPELPVNIYELGLIYDIKVKDEKFAIIKMTLTTPNCPVAESLQKEVKEHDPFIALDGGKDGLDAYKLIIPKLRNIIKTTIYVSLKIEW